MSRSPSPSTSSSILPRDTLQPPSGRSTGIVILSPRQSPTPEPPAALPATGADETATPPPPPQAAPPTESLAHGTVDGGRELVRDIARSEVRGGRGMELPGGAYYNEDGLLFPPPRPPPDSAPLTARPEDLQSAWDDFAFNSTIVGERSHPPPIPGVNQEEEEEDQEALFSSSLDAGEEALLRRRRRSRRRIILDPPPPPDREAEGGGGAEVSGMDLLTEDTGWVFIPSGAEPEISPEEERASRMAAAVEGRWDDSAWAAEETYLRQAEREMNEGREERASLWRNDPLSIPRTSALPRGGRFYPAAGSTFSPSNPPSYDRNPAARIVGTRVDFIAGDGAPPSRRTVPDADDEDEDEDDLLLRPYFRAPTRTPPPATTTTAFSGVPPASLSIFHSPPRPRVSESSNTGGNSALTFISSILPNPLQTAPRRRTREETNALMGHALRAKKGVYLLYCGGERSGGVDEEALPPGFSYADEEAATEAGTGKGCGALLCARALLDGVPGKIFSDEDARSGSGRERAAASSDLPPSIARVTDWDASGRGEGDGGERVGKRGWRGCKGCVTRDVGCKRCGNHLGYRLLRPCVTCSIARPSYTSYANVVSSTSTSSSGEAPHSPGGSNLTMIAGGVTGGGVVDGLLFHFKLDAVTPLQRLVGAQPEEELEGEKRARVVAGKRRALDEEKEEGGERERASPGRRGAGAAVGRRLVEKVPGVGEGMLWRNVPSAQRDFLDNLLGEPSDWITPSGETWWLENAVAKHTQRGSGYGYGGGAAGGGRKRRAEESGFGVDGHSSDRLSTATTTIDASTGTSSLSRSGAIRHRIPLASSSSSSSSPSGPTYPSISLSTSHPVGTGAVDEYDRFRADASDFSRRVRQRLADPAGEEGVVRGLERAGYGSGFGTEEDEGEGEELQAGLRRRTTGRERRRRESVGR